MSAVLNAATATPPDAALQLALDRACARIAPTWPLDQLIAVNPWWGMRDRPFSEVAARLAALADVRCLLTADAHAANWPGQVGESHLQRAAAEAGEADTAAEAAAEAAAGAATPVGGPHHWHNVSALVDGITRSGGSQMPWGTEIVQQISQFCAATFQDEGPLHVHAEVPGALYRHWLAAARADHGISVLMGEPGFPAQFAALPDDHMALLADGLRTLGVGLEQADDYLQALLLDVNGWASWIAYLRWQDELTGKTNHMLKELAAIRLAWDLALWRHLETGDAAAFRHLRRLWTRQLATFPELVARHADSQRHHRLHQRAAEIAYQQRLHARLRAPHTKATTAPRLQAAFCIDVRSEVMRRALEAQDPRIQTLGFAGFFGLPIEFQPAGTAFRRPQLPGLLSPGITVRAAGDGAAEARLLNRQARMAGLGDAPPATFSVVEATGLGYAFKLLRDSLFPAAATHPVNCRAPVDGFVLERDGQALDTADRAALAAGILRAMGLTDGFADTVMLIGHGSANRNNPHAAGLDCGACGGQTGEINVRVLASLLEDPAVRQALAGEGIEIPAGTRFVPALHDTTSDDVRCLTAGGVDAEIGGWLAAAGRRARRERAERLGLGALDDSALHAACRTRGRDWSQVRPEWGLAGNAAFIVAPRDRTRHIDLGGRAFLHDYAWQRDAGFGVLELIMTAPMLVTHWINLQYLASVTDPVKYGSGNKVLHNVVGGNLGVFEGNGGDLRIGLPMQSVHDGRRWMHEPLRLSVYIAAPRDAMADIAARHEVVRQLVDNEWLYLFRLDDDGRTIERLHRGRWLPAPDVDCA